MAIRACPMPLIQGIDTSKFHGLICAGGWMPDKLRRDPEVLRITREFAAAGKLVAAICHGGWIPISAKVYSGVNVTGSPGIKDDLINAGACLRMLRSLLIAILSAVESRTICRTFAEASFTSAHPVADVR